MSNFRIGSKVRVSHDNDNDCYNSFKDKILIITHIAKNTDEHPGYDMSVYPEPLYDFKDLDGNVIPCSFYKYEIVKA